uniref:OSJNBa0036B21.15 protein n=1 Tax=Oryza sativa subsp. japonica TaxID=39947 RepID=Q7XV03_ORYSJ|nr:OSJNBa0036B21.15 [Oryza sativa Japonica Group]
MANMRSSSRTSSSSPAAALLRWGALTSAPRCMACGGTRREECRLCTRFSVHGRPNSWPMKLAQLAKKLQQRMVSVSASGQKAVTGDDCCSAAAVEAGSRRDGREVREGVGRGE